MTSNTSHKNAYILYLGAGRCADLSDYVANTETSVVLVDANPEVCNFLEYETRNAPHITVVNAAVTGRAMKASFKLFNLEDLSGLNSPKELMESYPGLVSLRDTPVTTLGFEDVVKTNIPAKTSFDLIVDVNGSEGEIIREFLSSPYFKAVGDFTIIGAATPLYEAATPAEDIAAMLSSHGVEAKIKTSRDSDFVAIDGSIDHVSLERLANKKKIKALDTKLKQSQKQLSKTTKDKEGLEAESQKLKAELEALSKRVSETTDALKRSQVKNKTLEQNIENLNEQVSAVQTEKEQSQKYQAKLQGKNNHLASQIEQLKSDQLALEKAWLSEAEVLKSASGSAIEELQQMHLVRQTLTQDVKNLNDKLEATRAEQEQSVKHQGDLQGKSNHLSKQLKHLEGDLTSKSNELADLKAKYETAAEVASVDIKRLQSKLETATNANNDLVSQLDKLRAEQHASKMQNSDAEGERDRLLRRVRQLESELSLATSVDSDTIKKTRDAMKATYDSILADLTHQVTTLTTISKGKSDQLDQILAGQAALEARAEKGQADQAKAKASQDIVDDLKRELAEREATIKWHKRRYEDLIASPPSGKVAPSVSSETVKAKSVKSSETPPRAYSAIKSAPPRVILVASVPRSGGTWVFNAVRGIFETQKIPYASGWCKDFEGSANVKHHIVKAHKPDEFTATPWKVITNHRPIEQRIASLLRMGWVDDTDEGIKDALRHQGNLYTHWAKQSDVEVKFEKIANDPQDIIFDLGTTLGIKLDNKATKDVVDFVQKLKSPKSGAYDPVTLLHPRHVLSDREAHNARVEKIRKIMSKEK